MKKFSSKTLGDVWMLLTDLTLPLWTGHASLKSVTAIEAKELADFGAVLVAGVISGDAGLDEESAKCWLDRGLSLIYHFGEKAGQPALFKKYFSQVWTAERRCLEWTVFEYCVAEIPFDLELLEYALYAKALSRAQFMVRDEYVLACVRSGEYSGVGKEFGERVVRDLVAGVIETQSAGSREELVAAFDRTAGLGYGG